MFRDIALDKSGKIYMHMNAIRWDSFFESKLLDIYYSSYAYFIACQPLHGTQGCHYAMFISRNYTTILYISHWT